MQKTHFVRFRVTEEEFNRIEQNAEEKGFKTISDYLRHLALDVDIRFIKMLVEIHNKVVKNEAGN